MAPDLLSSGEERKYFAVLEEPEPCQKQADAAVLSAQGRVAVSSAEQGGSGHPQCNNPEYWACKWKTLESGQVQAP